jgi:hypothetical protein
MSIAAIFIPLAGDAAPPIAPIAPLSPALGTDCHRAGAGTSRKLPITVRDRRRSAERNTDDAATVFRVAVLLHYALAHAAQNAGASGRPPVRALSAPLSFYVKKSG